MAEPLKVGDTCYLFNENYRTYRRDASGRSVGSPIYREYFRPYVIVGEEKRSWLIRQAVSGLVGAGTKVAKGKVHSAAYVDDQVWLNTHRHWIREAVQSCTDASVLRQIAEVLNYVPAEG